MHLGEYKWRCASCRDTVPTDSAAIRLFITDESALQETPEHTDGYIANHYGTYFDFRTEYDIGRIHYESKTTQIVSRERGTTTMPSTHLMQITYSL